MISEMIKYFKRTDSYCTISGQCLITSVSIYYHHTNNEEFILNPLDVCSEPMIMKSTKCKPSAHAQLLAHGWLVDLAIIIMAGHGTGYNY